MVSLKTDNDKRIFSANYWGQPIAKTINFSNEKIAEYSISEIECIQLKSLSNITDEHAIKVAEFSHQLNGGFEIIRKSKNQNIYLERKGSVNDYYGTRIGLFYNGDISTWHRFEKTKEDDAKQFNTSIGKISISCRRPIPYIAISSYLRANGYALDWTNANGYTYTVDEMEKLGWIKLKSK